MLFADIMPCGFNATSAILTAILLLAIGVGSADSNAAPMRQGKQAGALPDPADVVDAFLKISQWVDSFSAPRLNDPASNHEIQNARAACIMLRSSGRVVGTGTDWTNDGLMIRRATGRALNDVLSDPALTPSRNPVPPTDEVVLDESGDEQLAKIGSRLIVDLEVAGPAVPLIGRTLQQMAVSLEPGLDGVALRRGDKWFYLFPIQARQLNLASAPDRVLLNLALQSGLELDELGDLSRLRDVSFYHFRTMHLAQSTPGGLPQNRLRGQVIVPETAVTPESIAKFADSLVDHLLAVIWPDPPEGIERKPLGVMGEYIVTADRFEPLIASPAEQALVAFALARYASVVEPDNIKSVEARSAAARLLRDLHDVLPGEMDVQNDPAAWAGVIFAVTEYPSWLDDETISPLFHDCTSRALGCFEPESGFWLRNESTSATLAISSHTQAMLAGAMARLMNYPQIKPDDLDAELVRAAIDTAWDSVAEPQRLSLLPWIGWAEDDFARATSQPFARADELKLLYEWLDDLRIGGQEQTEQRDLLGGFALHSENDRSSSGPVATAQSTRPAAWLASAMTDHRIVPADDADGAKLDHLRTMRFFMQLSIREPDRQRVRNPRLAMGGICSATWEARQPVPAQALALIAASDTLRVLRAIPADKAPAPN